MEMISTTYLYLDHIYPHCRVDTHSACVCTPEMKFHIILVLRFQNCAWCICSQSQNIVRLGSGLYLYDYRFIIIIITLGPARLGWCVRDSVV